MGRRHESVAQRRLRTGETQLGFIGIEIGFEPMTLDEFIKKVSVDLKKKKKDTRSRSPVKIWSEKSYLLAQVWQGNVNAPPGNCGQRAPSLSSAGEGQTYRCCCKGFRLPGDGD